MNDFIIDGDDLPDDVKEDILKVLPYVKGDCVATVINGQIYVVHDDDEKLTLEQRLFKLVAQVVDSGAFDGTNVGKHVPYTSVKVNVDVTAELIAKMDVADIWQIIQQALHDATGNTDICIVLGFACIPRQFPFVTLPYDVADEFEYYAMHGTVRPFSFDIELPYWWVK